MIQRKTKKIEYFDWDEMEKLIAAKFGKGKADKYWSDFVRDVDYTNPRSGGEIGHMNLFYYGPREKDCIGGTEESEEYRIQREEHFNWILSDEDILFRDITHFIWDTIEPVVDKDYDIEMCNFEF